MNAIMEAKGTLCHLAKAEEVKVFLLYCCISPSLRAEDKATNIPVCLAFHVFISHVISIHQF
jgi:hypothetical protein